MHTLLSSETNISALTQQVPEYHREVLHDIIYRTYTIYKSNFLVDVEKFKSFCFDTKVKVLTQLVNPNTNQQWIYLTPTVHGLLEHAAYLIDANGGQGLGSSTESSLEANNKVLRLVRINLSRKCSQYDNLSDCFQRLWIRSDYQVRKSIPKKKKSTSKEDFLKGNSTKTSMMPFPSLCDYYVADLRQ